MQFHRWRSVARSGPGNSLICTELLLPLLLQGSLCPPPQAARPRAPSRGAQSTLLSSVPFQTQPRAASSHRPHGQHVKNKSQTWYNMLTSYHLPHSTAKDTGILLCKVSDLLYIILYLDKVAAATPCAFSFKTWSFEKSSCKTLLSRQGLRKDTSATHPLPQVIEKTARWECLIHTAFEATQMKPRCAATASFHKVLSTHFPRLPPRFPQKHFQYDLHWWQDYWISKSKR